MSHWKKHLQASIIKNASNHVVSKIIGKTLLPFSIHCRLSMVNRRVENPSPGLSLSERMYIEVYNDWLEEK